MHGVYLIKDWKLRGSKSKKKKSRTHLYMWYAFFVSELIFTHIHLSIFFLFQVFEIILYTILYISETNANVFFCCLFF